MLISENKIKTILRNILREVTVSLDEITKSRKGVFSAKIHKQLKETNVQNQELNAYSMRHVVI